jgi:hypothetical protein
MTKRTDPPQASDEQVRALLERYRCPVPFHEVRTRFLGNIATPVMSASPMRVVEDLWGGELPVFDTIDEANELIGALVAGLWNRLTRHQDRNSPFRLTRIEPSTRLSHEPCLGVNTKVKRSSGCASSQALVSFEMCTE